MLHKVPPLELSFCSWWELQQPQSVPIDWWAQGYLFHEGREEAIRTPRASLPSGGWFGAQQELFLKKNSSQIFFYKSLPSFHWPVPFYVFHLAEEYKSSRIDSYSCLLTSAYDHLKSHFGNFHVLYVSGWLKIFFNILQYVICSLHFRSFSNTGPSKENWDG